MAEDNKPLDAEIVKPSAQRAKKTTLQRFKDAFIVTSAKDLKTFIVSEVIIPSIRDCISDIFHRGVDMTLYGESRATTRGRKGIYGASRPSYEEYYGKSKGAVVTKSASGYNLDDMVFESRQQADAAFEEMCEKLDEYNVVSVYDYYDICGQTADFTDHNYGWTSLEGSSILRDRNGWRLHMPKPSRIKD